jgi:hypothetical protein
MKRKIEDKFQDELCPPGKFNFAIKAVELPNGAEHQRKSLFNPLSKIQDKLCPPGKFNFTIKAVESPNGASTKKPL